MSIKRINADEIKDQIAEFFLLADSKNLPKTLPAIAEHLKWTTNEIIAYPTEGGELSETMNHAKLRCENWLMEQMINGRIDKSMAALIFRMHFGYDDSKKKKQPRRTIASIMDHLDEKV